MQTAIYSGLLLSNMLTLPGPPFICPSGNCTWDPFSTLSVNVDCSDMTSAVALNCSVDHSNVSTTDNGTTKCTFVSPNDTLLADMLVNASNNMFLVLDSYLLRDSLSALSTYANVTGVLATVQWVRVADFLSAENFDAIQPDTPYEAGRWLLYLSVDEIQAQVTNSSYSEEIMQEWTYCPLPSQAETLNGTTFAFWSPFNFGDDLVYQPPFAPGRSFSITSDDFDSLRSTILNTFSSSIIVGAAEPGTVNTNSLKTNDTVYGEDFWALMLVKADNMTRAMVNMASYMTTARRANDIALPQASTHNSTVLAPDQIAAGTVWVPTQFTVVRWGFVALPLVTLVLSAVFLSVVILRTRQLRIGIWKSNPLTLLLQTQAERPQGFDNFLAGKNLATASGMMDAAKTVDARTVGAPVLAIELSVRE